MNITAMKIPSYLDVVMAQWVLKPFLWWKSAKWQGAILRYWKSITTNCFWAINNTVVGSVGILSTESGWGLSEAGRPGVRHGGSQWSNRGPLGNWHQGDVIIWLDLRWNRLTTLIQRHVIFIDVETTDQFSINIFNVISTLLLGWESKHWKYDIETTLKKMTSKQCWKIYIETTLEILIQNVAISCFQNVPKIWIYFQNIQAKTNSFSVGASSKLSFSIN